jgi:hypothetical protein
MTLPERTLRLLDAMGQDRARAIVRVTDAALSPDPARNPSVHVVEVLPGLGIILVGPSRILQKISWLRLVELGPARYLLSIPTGTPVESLEVALHDLLEVVPADDVRERAMVERLGALMRTLRRDGSISKAEMLFRGYEARASGVEAIRDAERQGQRQILDRARHRRDVTTVTTAYRARRLAW